uniref:BED-type domain-containing protein n=1 Tax=Ditylenchus dipsaci TaxID=166011 RepID=A0A915D309_9BILA
MSLIWKIVLQGEDVSGFLFNKSSTTEAKCNVCSKFIPTPNLGPANLNFHLVVHPQYKKVLEEMENTEQLKKAACQSWRAISVGSDPRFKDRLARNNLKYNSDVIS